MSSSSNNVVNIDVNNPDFYHNLQDEIDSDLARLKKSVVIVKNLRSKILLFTFAPSGERLLPISVVLYSVHEIKILEFTNYTLLFY